jgi:hypothetical protein
MSVLNISIVSIIFLLLVIGIETMIKLKKSDNKNIEEVKNKLLLRINILMVLTVLLAILSIAFIILKK